MAEQFCFFDDAPVQLNPKGKTARKQAAVKAKMPLADVVEGRKRRDEGIARVRNNNPNFHSKALEAIKAIPAGTDGIAEWYRIQVTPSVGNPKHPNAWGAAISSLVKSGDLVPTGEYGPMTLPGSHARASQILRRT